jgi:hypothetical protein
MPEWLSYASVYLEAMRAVGDLNTDVLITVGRDADPGHARRTATARPG